MRCATGAASGLEAAADCGFSGQPVDLPEVEPESAALTPLWRVRGSRGKAFVDFQNDVTDEDVALAEHEGFRAVEHLKRYTTLGMATDQGKTSNVTGLALMAELTAKTIPQTGTTTFRPPFTPVADRRARRPASRQGVPADAAAAVAPLGAGAGRGVRRDRRLAARAVVSAGRRDRLARERQPRGADGARQRRRLRRLDARQDRPAGAGRRRVPRPALHQHLDHARRRPRALRRDAARGRLRARRRHDLAARRGPLLHHHHHGQRRQGAPAHGVLPPVAVAGARRAVLLGQRAVGAVLRRRAALARRAAQDRRSAARHLQRGLSLHGRGRADGDGRHPGAPLPHLVLGRAGLRDRRAGALWRRADPAPHGGRPASSASRPTAPRRSASCASRRATSPATRSTARPPRAIWGSAA